MTHGGYVVRRVRAEDWPQVRDLRLRMLLDTPKAYLETYAAAAALDDNQWRARVARHLQPGSAQFVAVTDDGAWVGTAAVFVESAGQAHLVGVFVDPHWRGRGVIDALVAQVQQWAREAGARRMRLFVHEDNPRARAYYQRAGFMETGATMPYELDPDENEIEMVRELD